MQTNSNTKTATWIIVLGVLVSVLQSLACRFIGTPVVILILSAVLLTAGSFVLIHVTQDFEACFGFQLICLLFQIIVTVTIYPYAERSLPDNRILVLLCVLNWFVPAFFSLLLYLFNRSGHYENYNAFFRNSTILFVLVYVAFLGYGLFWNNAAYHDYQPDNAAFSLLPFATIASKVQAVILEETSLSSLIYYLLSHMVLYIPYGFLLALLLKPLPVFVRLLSLLVLPVLTDVLQYVFRLGHSDIDDMILGFIGALFGMLCFVLLNLLCRKVTGSEYLEKEGRKNYYQTNIRY